MEAILSSQTESGAFGPTSSLGNWWSRMPALMGMRDYYEATVHQGNPDERVLPFFEKYYRYQAKELPNRPLSDWGDAAGETISNVFSGFITRYMIPQTRKPASGCSIWERCSMSKPGIGRTNATIRQYASM